MNTQNNTISKVKENEIILEGDIVEALTTEIEKIANNLVEEYPSFMENYLENPSLDKSAMDEAYNEGKELYQRRSEMGKSAIKLKVDTYFRNNKELFKGKSDEALQNMIQTTVLLATEELQHRLWDVFQKKEFALLRQKYNEVKVHNVNETKDSAKAISVTNKINESNNTFNATQSHEQSKVRNRNKISTRLREVNDEWRNLCDDCLSREDMTEETKELVIGFYALQMKSLARIMKSTLRSFRADSKRKPAYQYGDAHKAFAEYATELLRDNLKNLLNHELNFIG